MIPVTSSFVLSSVFHSDWIQITGEDAIKILCHQNYTHILIDDNGYIDAISPHGTPIQGYKLFLRKTPTTSNHHEYFQ